VLILKIRLIHDSIKLINLRQPLNIKSKPAKLFHHRIEACRRQVIIPRLLVDIARHPVAIARHSVIIARHLVAIARH
jgi:hypothetical protein